MGEQIFVGRRVAAERLDQPRPAIRKYLALQGIPSDKISPDFEYPESRNISDSSKCTKTPCLATYIFVQPDENSYNFVTKFRHLAQKTY